jgi:hypothetical protein
VTENVVAEVVGVEITHELCEADLMIDDEQGLGWLDWGFCSSFKWYFFNVDLGKANSLRCPCPVCSMLAREQMLPAGGLL